MSSGYRNNLAKQIAEHLVCAELGRHDLLATPFSGNVPKYDVLVADDSGRALPIQVKASRRTNWQENARDWMDLEYDAQTKSQRYLGRKTLPNPDLVYVLVALAPSDSSNHDRFFVMTMADLQDCCVRHYKVDMDMRGWRRPKKPDSFHISYEIGEIEDFEDNWALIGSLLHQ
jgi:hypothetical protein